MARPREYERDAVVAAAKEVFWRHGYEAAGLDMLEEATHLSRSSLYLAFGSKRGLFNEAMAEYRSTFIASVLGPVEADGSTAEDAAGVFATIASLLRGELYSRGCLIINAIGELAGRDADMAQEGADFYERYRRAFAKALGGAVDADPAQHALNGDRAQLLAVSAIGIWIAARVDPAAAAQACDVVVRQIRVWVQP